jgi:7SK snRNA methylphosphate capping enzyme
VPQNDEFLRQIKPEYDFILALSLTKWIHLNNGDEGIKRFFKKIYLNLTVNGSLLLEPQSWTSYKKKAKLSVSFIILFFQLYSGPHHFLKVHLNKLLHLYCDFPKATFRIPSYC